MVLRVSVCMIIKSDKILLINRNKEPYNSWWAFPGGKIEKGENEIDAAIREIKEETGIDINPTLYCKLDELLIDNNEIINKFSLFYHKYRINYSPNLIENTEGELKWFFLINLPVNMVPSDKKIIELYLMDTSPFDASCILNRTKTDTSSSKKVFDYELIKWAILN